MEDNKMYAAVEVVVWRLFPRRQNISDSAVLR
jgi:hypothetical protein